MYVTGCNSKQFVCELMSLTVIQYVTSERSTFKLSFYSASVLLAMLTAVLARLFVHLSVCPSFRHVLVLCPQTNEDSIVWFSASGRTILLVSEEVKFIWIFAGDHP